MPEEAGAVAGRTGCAVTDAHRKAALAVDQGQCGCGKIWWILVFLNTENRSKRLADLRSQMSISPYSITIMNEEVIHEW